jgi:hypothetical protein
VTGGSKSSEKPKIIVPKPISDYHPAVCSREERTGQFRLFRQPVNCKSKNVFRFVDLHALTIERFAVTLAALGRGERGDFDEIVN